MGNEAEREMWQMTGNRRLHTFALFQLRSERTTAYIPSQLCFINVSACRVSCSPALFTDCDQYWVYSFWYRSWSGNVNTSHSSVENLQDPETSQLVLHNLTNFNICGGIIILSEVVGWLVLHPDPFYVQRPCSFDVNVVDDNLIVLIVTTNTIRDSSSLSIAFAVIRSPQPVASRFFFQIMQIPQTWYVDEA